MDASRAASRAALMPTLLSLVLLGAGLARGDQPRAPELIFEAPPALEPVAERLRGSDTGRHQDVMRLIGLDHPGRPVRVILAAEGSDAARGVAPWIVGYAYGALDLIILLPERAPAYPDSSLDELLAHELAHVLITRAAAGHPVPRWFHEGLALVAGTSWGLDDRSRLTLALMVDADVPLGTLDERFAGGRGTVDRAYAVAGAFVRYLLRRFGSGTAREILAGVAIGQPFDEAFRRTTGTTLARVEASFWRRHAIWYRWVPLLTSSFALWLGVTLLALVAIHRRRRRDAALMRRWEQEERWLTDVRAGENGPPPRLDL